MLPAARPRDDCMAIEIDPTTITAENNALATAAILMKVNEISVDIREFKADISADMGELRHELSRQCDRHDSEMSSLRDEVKCIGKKVDEHERTMIFLKFSSCEVIPWIKRNKNKIGFAVLIVSGYLSLLDWINRWLQWSFLPPT